MAYSGRERRVYPRWPFARAIQLGCDGKWRTCASINLSFGGILVATADPPPQGARVSLRITSDRTPEPLEIDGLVVRCTMDEGVGIGFVDLDNETEEVLRQMIELLEQSE
ncbi:PilZ domain-containing protein [Myxococcota bacterium]